MTRDLWIRFRGCYRPRGKETLAARMNRIVIGCCGYVVEVKYWIRKAWALKILDVAADEE